ncbi:hypothetical protein ACNSOS_04495 [Aliarcobacter vitoriensis]|uniref:hypothetical protein n=1 Tax=Aliarcobacter TaxID=2321111 RepID=UPI003AA9D685
MSEKNKRRLKAVKTIYGKEAFEDDLKIKYGSNTFVAWWILGYDTIEELEAKYTDEEILEMHDERYRSEGIKIS